MDSILVTGNGPLSGKISIAGAKNACLALMPVTLLTDEPVTLTNAPILSDIKTADALLSSLGTEVTFLNGGKVLVMSSHNLNSSHADYDIVRKMRASNLVLGPLLARFGKGYIPKPGGDKIGRRRLDTHFEGLKLLGADFNYNRQDYFYNVTANKLTGVNILLEEASVTGTANILMAAVLASGKTTIYNAAVSYTHLTLPTKA